MNMTGLPLIKALEERMRYLSARQSVLSENIANADTPGYQSRDAVAPNFGDILGATSTGRNGKAQIAKPRINAPVEMARLGSQAASSLRVEKDGRAPGVEVKPNGNSVVLEEQLVKMADVQADYAAINNLYRKQVNMFRIALGKGR
jgi:flagellar basal-body rod protein FlgB